MKEDCKAHFDRLSACLDGELPECDLDEVMKHVAECDCCRHCLSTLKITRELLKKTRGPALPEDIKARLKACLRESK